MKISRRRLAKEVVRALQSTPEHKGELIQQLAAHLLVNKKANQADLLMLDIANELEESQGQLVATVSSARPLSDASKVAVVAKLKKQTGAKNVELNEELKPELIGGIVVRTPKYELDSSVKRQLNQIAAKGVN
ncbi:MAG TPA: F0F1 ATP synthase subunit delta [Candidatus Saccharimonadales bacterium]|nr:F0F1 ATP synthase subunit delta [Candidatus Saccharimonadales bacterium]